MPKIAKLSRHVQIGEIIDADATAELDVEKLVTSRLLIQSNSGGGKSWALRRLLEQTYGSYQQIVLDPEDEFYTLRERFDYVLAREDDGDVVPHPKNARDMARSFLELGVSAIISLYEMNPPERILFVRKFLEAMINAPKSLWHPVIVVLDEAHVFCPQAGQAESADAVISLMSRGRKRGFCGILATQRLSKLHKDAAAETNNKMIGRSTLDIDRKRAGDELGFTTKKHLTQLQRCKPGEFFVAGPAFFGLDVHRPLVGEWEPEDYCYKIKVGSVGTSHPQAGAGTVPVPPAKGKIKKLLKQLEEIPEQAQKHVDEVESLRTQVRELKRELKTHKGPGKPLIVQDQLNRLLKEERQRVSAELNEKWHNHWTAQFERVGEELRERLEQLKPWPLTIEPTQTPTKLIGTPTTEPNPLEDARQTVKHTPGNIADDAFTHDGTMTKMAKVLWATLRAWHEESMEKNQLAVYAGLLSDKGKPYSAKGGGFNNALSELRNCEPGPVLEPGFPVKLASYGLDYQPAGISIDRVPTGEALVEYLCRVLNKCEAAIIEALYWHAVDRQETKEELGERTGYASTGGGFNNALSRLRTMGLLEGKGSEPLRLSHYFD